MMVRRLIVLLLLAFGSVFSSAYTSAIRILELLPYVVQPPLVEPCLPEGFILGKQIDDPFFTEGYYWGLEKCLDDYFADPALLKGCLIRAQVSTSVSQIGHDRFSNDGKTHDLTAVGFSEIKTHRGKWGIFPFREIVAKGPKGKWYYQMWVGLNTDEGATLCFQLLYPEYLTEPTQTQKDLWKNFVQKTSLLSMSDLLIARGVAPQGEKKEVFAFFTLEKRRVDQKFLVKIAPYQESFSHIEVAGVEEVNLLSALEYGRGHAAIEVVLTDRKDKISSETVMVPYSLVHQFTFENKMLSPKAIEERANFLIIR